MASLSIAARLGPHGLEVLWADEAQRALRLTAWEQSLSLGHDGLHRSDKIKGAAALFPCQPLPGLAWKGLHQAAPPAPYDALLCRLLAAFWPFMPAGQLPPPGPLCLSLPEMTPCLVKEEEEVIFYGGTFHPPHAGHLACLQQVPGRQVVIVPDANPWKERQKESNAFLAYKGLCRFFSAQNGHVYPGFMGLTTPNPTIQWLADVSIKKKSLLMGDDNFLKIESWARSDMLLAMLSGLYVVPRLSDRTELIRHKERLRKKYPAIKIEVLEEHPYQRLSSTEIRSKDSR